MHFGKLHLRQVTVERFQKRHQVCFFSAGKMQFIDEL